MESNRKEKIKITKRYKADDVRITIEPETKEPIMNVVSKSINMQFHTDKGWIDINLRGDKCDLFDIKSVMINTEQLFKCKSCGNNRMYINQYCPNCGSCGPHIPK